MKTVTQLPHKVIVHEDYGITLSDGCRLSARIWMPEDAETSPAPAILEHLPYRKRDGTIARDEQNHPWFAGHGYIVIRTDMRGNGESDGLMHDEYTAQELADAVEVIEWIASQPFCNGKVGMMGISWGGFNALQVADLRPNALKAIITCCSTVDRYADDIHYKGGCLLGENFGWSSNMLAYSSRPPDKALVGDRWKAMWKDRLENMDMPLSIWIRHQHRDDYWKHGSVRENYSNINAAVLSIGGWHDGYRNTISHLVENIKAPVKGIVGPWIHKYPNYAKPEPAIGFLQEAKRWWDQYLKGIDTDVDNDPDYRAYLMDSIKPERWVNERPGRWISEQSWPSKNITTSEWFLGNDNHLGKSATTLLQTINSPLDCGAAAGEYFPFAFSDELPAEQTPDDEGSACFDSAALTQMLDIVGDPEINLTLSCDKACGQVAVRLLDCRPDGTSALITYGVLNLTHHLSHESPKALTPGKAISIAFNLDQIAYRVPEGHKLRVAISTAYWPLIWPSPEKITLTLTEGALKLPTRSPAVKDEWDFEPPEATRAWQVRNLRRPEYQRSVSTDQQTGESITEVYCDFGEDEDLAHGLVSGAKMQERWSILPTEPHSARVEAQWHHNGGRAGNYWYTTVTTSMHSTTTQFIFEAELQAYIGDELFFSRKYQDSVARELV